MSGKLLRGALCSLCLLGALSVASIGMGAGTQSSSEEESGEQPQQFDALSVLQNNLREVTQRVLPAVVEVDAVNFPRSQDLAPIDLFFGPKEQMEKYLSRRNSGSGVIVRRLQNRAYVLTNYHVTRGADQISIRLFDGRVYRATSVGSEKRTDLALLAFETEEDLSVAKLGDSDQVQIGDLVCAVGNPFGVYPSISMGIVSTFVKKNQPDTGFHGPAEYIQTDATVHRGASGGALVNLRGEVIGINSWIAPPPGGETGLNFTIPINVVKAVVEDFLTKGRVGYGWLGINAGDLLPEVKNQMGLRSLNGAFIFDVFKGSPADRYGLLPGDFIVGVNGKGITDASSLLFTVSELSVGKSAEFEILRYGEQRKLQVKISDRDEEQDISRRMGSLWPGMTLLYITDELHKQLNLPRRMGEIIVGSVTAGGPAWSSGLKPGDVIQEINGEAVKSMTNFYRSLNAQEGRSTVLVYRKATALTFVLQLP
jgi:serine protease Do